MSIRLSKKKNVNKHFTSLEKVPRDTRHHVQYNHMKSYDMEARLRKYKS